MSDRTLLMGAVAYGPKVVTVWEGFRRWLRDSGLPFHFRLYSSYERQVEDLIAGRIGAAWNSPLAWLRAQRLAEVAGRTVRAVAMRDTDCDLTSVVVVRTDSEVQSLAGLRGRTVAVGAVDSPQATLIPLAHLHAAGLRQGQDITVRRFDVGVGLHGDHVGGERAAAAALAAGKVDAACMADANHVAFTREGTLASGATRILCRTAPYDHRTMTLIDTAPEELAIRFIALLLSMSYEDPRVRPLLDLGGLRTWQVGRTSGYSQLETAVGHHGVGLGRARRRA